MEVEEAKVLERFGAPEVLDRREHLGGGEPKLAAVTARGSPLARAGASEASTQTDLRSLTTRCAELEQELELVEPLDHDDHVEPERLRVEAQS